MSSGEVFSGDTSFQLLHLIKTLLFLLVPLCRLRRPEPSAGSWATKELGLGGLSAEAPSRLL